VARLAAKQTTGVAPVGRYIIYNYMRFFQRITAHGPLWPAYLMRHRPFLARLVFSNEKAWLLVGLGSFTTVGLSYPGTRYCQYHTCYRSIV